MFYLKVDMERIRKEMINAAKAGIKSSYESEEYALIQAVNAINEIDRSYNLMFERLGEWYGIYFPELRINNPSTLAKLVELVASKEGITTEDVEGIVGTNESAKEISEKMSNTIGREMAREEGSVLLAYAKLTEEISVLREVIKSYINSATERLLPNTVYLTDNMVAAELLSKAGSLERLVIMPAGTIQLLGAEKALFKHIKFGSKPPKYGVLFSLPAISSARRDVRGKLARAYSAKIATALKADIITKRFIGEELKASLDKSVERILSSKPHARPPQRQQRRYKYRKR